MVETINPTSPVFLQVRIESITKEAPGVATYHLSFVYKDQRAAYKCLPGQFNLLSVSHVGEIPAVFSGYDAATDTFAHTIRNAGDAAGGWERIGVGDELGLRGPFGTSWPIEACSGHDVVLLAGGMGLVALRPAIDAILARRLLFGRVTLIYGARTPSDLLFTSQFDSWIQRKIDVSTTVDRAVPGWRGSVGAVPMLLDRMRLPAPINTAVLTSGPEVMMRYSIRTALDHGIRSRLIWLSLERSMQCVAGMCQHNPSETSALCQAGAIFRHDQAASLLMRPSG